jgi:hypothetical protein
MTAQRKPDPIQAHTLIQNCTFDASSKEGDPRYDTLKQLARAAKENARAIQAIAEAMRGPMNSTMLNIQQEPTSKMNTGSIQHG